MPHFAVSSVGGFDRTQDYRYVNRKNPNQLWVSQSRAKEENPDATAPLLAELSRRNMGPRQNKVNPRLVLYKVDEIKGTDFRALAGDDPDLNAAISTPITRTPKQPDTLSAIRALNGAIREGTVSVTIKQDGTLRALVEVG